MKNRKKKFFLGTIVLMLLPACTRTAKYYFDRGTTKMNEADYTESIIDFTKATDLYPQYPEAYNSRGVAKKVSGDNTGAFEDFSKAIVLDSTFLQAYINRIEIEGALHDYHGLYEDYQKALRLYSKSKHTLNATSSLNNTPVVIDTIDFIIISKKYLKEIIAIGNKKYNENNFKEAVEYYSMAIGLNPEYSESYFFRANGRFLLKDCHVETSLFL